MDITKAIANMAPRPKPMTLGLYTDGMRGLSFEEMLDTCVDIGIEVLELGVGGFSSAPHVNVEQLVDSKHARHEFLAKIADKGLRIAALNCSGNPIAPGELGKRHAGDIERAMMLAELLEVDTIVAMSGLPAGCEGDQCPNWVTAIFPFENTDILEYQWDIA